MFQRKHRLMRMKIISPQKAYNILCRGDFYSDELIKNDLLYTVKSMYIVYIADSKGFYQLVYEFVLDNEKDKEVHINIVAKNEVIGKESFRND